jgi:hypothetical protein
MSWNVQFSRYTLPSSGATYQIIKPLAPRGYSGCSKLFPSIARQIEVRCTALSQTHLTHWHQTDVTAACILATRPSALRKGTAQTCSFRCPHIKIIHRSLSRWARRPCNRPSTSNPLSCICSVQTLSDITNVLELGRAETTTSFSQREAHLEVAPTNVSRRSLYRWAVSLSGNTQGHTTMSLSTAAQTPTLKRALRPRSQIAWWVSRAMMRTLWILNTP